MHENWDERKMGGGDTLLFQICYLKFCSLFFKFGKIKNMSVLEQILFTRKNGAQNLS